MDEAEQDEVGQAGAAAVFPGVDVVGGAPGGGDPAAGEPAAPVPGGQGAALGGGVGAVAASGVEGEPVAPADEGDVGVAGQGEDLAGGEHGAVGGPGWPRAGPGCAASWGGLDVAGRMAGRRLAVMAAAFCVEQDGQVGPGAVAGSGRAGVEGGLAGGGQAVHPALGGGPPVVAAAGRAECLSCGPDDFHGQGIAAGAADRAGVIQRHAEGQVTPFEPLALAFLDGVGVGAVGQVLTQPAQLPRIQTRRHPGPLIGRVGAVRVAA